MPTTDITVGFIARRIGAGITFLAREARDDLFAYWILPIRNCIRRARGLNRLCLDCGKPCEEADHRLCMDCQIDRACT